MRTINPGRLTVRVFTGFEPFAFRRDRRLVGFDIDVLSAFARGAGLPIDFEESETFEGIWLIPGTGDADIATAGIARFTEREHPGIEWSEPYYEVQRSILVHRDRATELRGIGDFEHRTIAFVQGSTADLDTRARAPEHAVLRPIRDQRQGIALLDAGAIDGLAMGAPSNAYNQRMHPQYCLIDVHEFTQPEGLRFPVSADNNALLGALNTYIAAARSSGDIARHVEQWLADGLG